MKAKRGLMMLAAILILGGSSVLTSCSDDSGEPTSARDILVLSDADGYRQQR